MLTESLIAKAESLGLTDAIAKFKSKEMSKRDLEHCVAHVLESTYRKQAASAKLHELKEAAGADHPVVSLFKAFGLTRSKIRIGG